MTIPLPNGAQIQVAPAKVPTIAVPPTAPSTLVVMPVVGPQGGAGQPGGSVARVTAAALSGHRVVTPLDDGTVNYADATNAAHVSRPMWLTTSAWNQGDTATLVSDGPVTEPSWNWTPGQPIYLGASGQLTQTEAVGAVFTLIVAEVIDATTISFRPQVPIVKG